MTRIGLVGGHAYERDLVVSWLRAVPGVASVTGVVADDPLRAPLVLDLAVAVVDGDEADPLDDCRELTGLEGPGTVAAVLRTAFSSRVIERLAVAGADALVSMASGPDALSHAICRVRSGGVWLDPALSPFVMQQLGAVPDELLGLTPRELEVARCLPRELSRREIANALGVSVETVKTHICNIYAKSASTTGSLQRDSSRRVWVASRGDSAPGRAVLPINAGDDR